MTCESAPSRQLGRESLVSCAPRALSWCMTRHVGLYDDLNECTDAAYVRRVRSALSVHVHAKAVWAQSVHVARRYTRSIPRTSLWGPQRASSPAAAACPQSVRGSNDACVGWRVQRAALSSRPRLMPGRPHGIPRLRGHLLRRINEERLTRAKLRDHSESTSSRSSPLATIHARDIQMAFIVTARDALPVVTTAELCGIDAIGADKPLQLHMVGYQIILNVAAILHGDRKEEERIAPSVVLTPDRATSAERKYSRSRRYRSVRCVACRAKHSMPMQPQGWHMILLFMIVVSNLSSALALF